MNTEAPVTTDVGLSIVEVVALGPIRQALNTNDKSNFVIQFL